MWVYQCERFWTGTPWSKNEIQSSSSIFECSVRTDLEGCRIFFGSCRHNEWMDTTAWRCTPNPWDVAQHQQSWPAGPTNHQFRILTTITLFTLLPSLTSSQNLENFKKTPGYNLYLAFIFALNEESFSVRTCAGLILKNNLLSGTVDKSEQVYVKNQVVKAIGDADPTVRRTAGSLITTIISTSTKF